MQRFSIICIVITKTFEVIVIASHESTKDRSQLFKNEIRLARIDPDSITLRGGGSIITTKTSD